MASRWLKPRPRGGRWALQNAAWRGRGSAGEGGGGAPPVGGLVGAFYVENDGQSNEQGSQTTVMNPADAYIGEREGYEIYQMALAGGSSGSIIYAEERLRYPFEGTNDNIGHIMAFCKRLMDLNPGITKMVIGPCAIGGRAYTTTGWGPYTFDGIVYGPGGVGDGVGDWASGGPLDMLSKAVSAKALADDPTLQYLALVGHCAENDQIQFEERVANYVTSIEERRALFNSTALLIMNDRSPAYIGLGYVDHNMNSAQHAVSQRTPYAVCASSPDGPYDPVGSDVHFERAAQGVRGERAADLVALALERTAVFTLPTDILDTMGVTADFAVSIWRRLRAGYAGPLFRLYRTNDAAEVDIDYDATTKLTKWADVETFMAASAGSDIRIRPYDQSGNGRDVSHPTPTSWPKFGDNGYNFCRDKAPFVDNDGKALYNLTFTTAETSGLYAVLHCDETVTGRIFSSPNVNFGLTDNPGSPKYTTAGAGGGTELLGYAVPTNKGNTRVIVTSAATAANSARENGVAQTIIATTTGINATQAGAFSIGGRVTASGGTIASVFSGAWAEFILAPTAYTAPQIAVLEQTIPWVCRDEFLSA